MGHSENHITKTLAERFLQTAERYPDRPGLHPGLHPYTYAQLKQAAMEAAENISRNHSGPFVPVMADKSFTCYTTILGALLAGKAYLPLNPKFPEARNRFMTEKAQKGSLDMAYLEDPGRMPAYLLFTSGSTGEPKGVAVSHANVCAYLDFMLEAYDFSPEDRFTQVFDLTFDLSVHDLFLCWSTGGCLCVPDDNSSFAMAKFIKEVKPTVWFSVPSTVMLMDRMRLLKPEAFPSVRLSFFCGEPLYGGMVEAWKQAASNSRIANLYGPTEATIAVSRYDIPSNAEMVKQEMGIVSIGKIFQGNDYLLHETSPDKRGELCLSGKQVVDGYFDNPAADQQSFFTDNAGKRWYKTGDLVREDAGGDLFFLGRLDAEVKISGYRVNLKEVESVLTANPSVDQSVVLYERQNDGPGIMIAFILPENKDYSNEPEMDAWCRAKLPWYMIPGKFIFVDEIPLNRNGKTDKQALLNKYFHGK